MCWKNPGNCERSTIDVHLHPLYIFFRKCIYLPKIFSKFILFADHGAYNFAHLHQIPEPIRKGWDQWTWYMGVSKNKGTPKWKVYNGKRKTLLKWMIGGYHYFRKHSFSSIRPITQTSRRSNAVLHAELQAQALSNLSSSERLRLHQPCFCQMIPGFYDSPGNVCQHKKKQKTTFSPWMFSHPTKSKKRQMSRTRSSTVDSH